MAVRASMIVIRGRIRSLSERPDQPTRCIAAANPTERSLLAQALERQLEREDLARRLRAAYLENGQLAWAAEIQREHAIDA